MVITIYTKFVSAKTCYCPKVCQLQRQLLLVVTSLNIHNPHVRSTHSHCCCNVFYIIHMIACVSNLGEKYSNSFNLSYFPLFTPCIFLSVVFFILIKIFWLSHDVSSCQKCDRYWFKLETCPILHPVHLSNTATTLESSRHMDLWSVMWCPTCAERSVCSTCFGLELKEGKNYFKG